MGINQKGSRKIIVNDQEFRWRATGNDGGITLVLWPIENDNSRLVGEIDYHSSVVKTGEDCYSAIGQVVITNRMVREVILHYRVNYILENKGQINIGALENFFDVSKAVRAQSGTCR